MQSNGVVEVIASFWQRLKSNPNLKNMYADVVQEENVRRNSVQEFKLQPKCLSENKTKKLAKSFSGFLSVNTDAESTDGDFHRERKNSLASRMIMLHGKPFMGKPLLDE